MYIIYQIYLFLIILRHHTVYETLFHVNGFIEFKFFYLNYNCHYSCHLKQWRSYLRITINQ